MRFPNNTPILCRYIGGPLDISFILRYHQYGLYMCTVYMQTISMYFRTFADILIDTGLKWTFLLTYMFTCFTKLILCMKIVWGTSNMLQISYSVIVLATIILCSKEAYLKMFYGERTNDYPKSSCLDIGKSHSTGRCLAVCGTSLEMLIMISHNMETHTCMCCDDITGSDIIGSNWKTYIPRKCKLNY